MKAKNVLASSFVLVSLIAVIVSAYFVVSYRTTAQGIPDYHNCEPASLSEAEVAVKATILTNGDTPQLVSALTVHIPASAPLAADLLQSRDGIAYKSAVQCLLGLRNDIYTYERRDSPPKVTKTGGAVLFEDSVLLDVTGPLAVSCGLISATSPDPTHWTLAIVSSKVLDNAKWTDVSVVAPVDWLSSPSPWPPSLVTPTEIRWSPNVANQRPPFSVLAKRDLRTNSILATGIPPGSTFATILFWLNDLLVSLVVLILLYALKWKRITTIPLSGGVGNPYAFILPPIFFELASFGLGVLQDWPTSPLRNWTTIYWYASIGMLLFIVAAAVVWRLDPRAVTACGAAGVILLLILLVAMGEDWTNLNIGDQATAVVIAYCGLVYIFYVLLFAGSANAIYRLIALSPNLSAQRRCWVGAAAFSLLLVAERLGLNLAFYSKQEWLSIAPIGPGHLSGDLQSISYTLLYQLSDLFLIVVLACIWRVVRTSLAEREDPTIIKVMAGTLFVFGVSWWSAYFWGWWLPLWVPLTLFVAFALRRAKYLPIGANDDSASLAQEVIGKSIADLTVEATRWQVEQQKRLALERGLTTGKDEFRAYKAWAEKVEEESQEEQPAAVRKVRRWLNDNLRPSTFNVSHSVIRITPIDVLFAVGPSKSALANAREAMRISRIVGALAAAFLTWKWLTYYPLNVPDVLDSAVVPTVAFFAWSFLGYLFGGAVLGLLWHYLPGKRGPIKALPIALFYSFVPAVRFLIPQMLGGYKSTEPLADALTFTATIMIVAVAMDWATLKGLNKIWTRPWRSLIMTYGVQNLPAQITFVVAQVGAAIAIWNFIKNGGEPPSANGSPRSIFGGAGSAEGHDKF